MIKVLYFATSIFFVWLCGYYAEHDHNGYAAAAGCTSALFVILGFIKWACDSDTPSDKPSGRGLGPGR